MTAARWDRIKAVFDSALDLPPADRLSFLATACQDDDELLREVRRLLTEFEQSSDFLAEPAAYVGLSLTTNEVVAGRYRVVRMIGRGGMGEVYEVYDEFLKESVALKT